VYTVIADPTRRAMLLALGEGARKPSQLCAVTGASPSAVSQHLSVLLTAGMVSRERKGREQHYRLEAAPLREVTEWVGRFERFWDDKLAALGDYLEKTE
jgi:DNA-binding transcriptional ArsR family regulator